MSYAASKRGKVQHRQAEAARRAAEEQARREAEARRRRRRALAWGSVALVLVVAVVVTVTRVQAAREHERLRGPNNMISDGLVVYGDGERILGLETPHNDADEPARATGSARILGIADMKFFVDYTDPEPAAFWAANGEELTDQLLTGDVSLEIHPIGTDETAVAAGAALACVAEHARDQGLAAHDALLRSQDRVVAASAADLPAVLQDVLAGAGVDDDAVASCVADGRFRTWVTEATQRAEQVAVYPEIGPVARSTMFVLDLPWTGEPDDSEGFMEALRAALSQVRGEALGIDETDTDAES